MLSKCLPETCPWEEVTCSSPVSLTTAAISPMVPPLEKLGFGWVGSGSSSGRCKSEQGQCSWRQAWQRHSTVRMGLDCELISGEAMSNQRLLRGSFISHLRESCSLQEYQ